MQNSRKKTIIMTESHSGIGSKEAKEKGIRVLPMPFYFQGRCYMEDEAFSREEFFKKLKETEDVKTSQPSPDFLGKEWEDALKEYEEIIYIPISSGLSGTCMMAASLATEKRFEDKVFVVDNGRVSTPLHRSVLDAVELLDAGYPSPEIKRILEDSRGDMVIYVAVDDLTYLKRGGRISGTTAVVGQMLHVKPVLQFDTGLLSPYRNARGMNRARAEMIAAMKEELGGRFAAQEQAGEVHLVAASSAPDEVTEDWLRQIKEEFPGREVMCDDLSYAVSCHIGPGGLGIGCSCKPRIRG